MGRAGIGRELDSIFPRQIPASRRVAASVVIYNRVSGQWQEGGANKNSARARDTGEVDGSWFTSPATSAIRMVPSGRVSNVQRPLCTTIKISEHEHAFGNKALDDNRSEGRF